METRNNNHNNNKCIRPSWWNSNNIVTAEWVNIYIYLVCVVYMRRRECVVVHEVWRRTTTFADWYSACITVCMHMCAFLCVLNDVPVPHKRTDVQQWHIIWHDVELLYDIMIQRWIAAWHVHDYILYIYIYIHEYLLYMINRCYLAVCNFSIHRINGTSSEHGIWIDTCIWMHGE